MPIVALLFVQCNSLLRPSFSSLMLSSPATACMRCLGTPLPLTVETQPKGGFRLRVVLWRWWLSCFSASVLGRTATAKLVHCINAGGRRQGHVPSNARVLSYVSARPDSRGAHGVQRRRRYYVSTYFPLGYDTRQRRENMRAGIKCSAVSAS